MEDIEQLLKKYADRYETEDFLPADPSWFMHQVKGINNQETLAFVASCLSYGNRKQFFPKIQYILDSSGGDVYNWVLSGLFANYIQDDSSKCYYRLYTMHTMYTFLSAFQDMLKDVLLALGVAIFLVYAVMVIQFNRFSQPFIILLSIPFCLIGVILGLMIFGSQISLIALLGIIALAGVVVNNAIVLVDYINFLRDEKGMELRPAIIAGCQNRLRPILMTTLTTLFGVLPLAFSKGNGAEVYAPLGQAIFGGLLTSTLITLVLIPILYEGLEIRKLRRIKAENEAEK